METIARAAAGVVHRLAGCTQIKVLNQKPESLTALALLANSYQTSTQIISWPLSRAMEVVGAMENAIGAVVFAGGMFCQYSSVSRMRVRIS